MLGKIVKDPDGHEGCIKEAEGLGLIDMSTVITSDKTLTKATHKGAGALAGADVSGYEMHMGATSINGGYEQLSETDNLIIRSGKVTGTYLHGLFESGKVTEKIFVVQASDYKDEKERQLSKLADMIKENCDVAKILKGVGL